MFFYCICCFSDDHEVDTDDSKDDLVIAIIIVIVAGAFSRTSCKIMQDVERACVSVSVFRFCCV